MSPTLQSERHGHVLRLTLSDPRRRNALDPAMYAAGHAALAQAAADDGIGAVVLTGAGDTFCAGGNLRRLIDNRGEPRGVQRRSVEGLHGLVRALRACPRPVIAAVEGAAAGAGFSLALACDLVVAAEDAVFTMAYVKVGLNPDGGATTWLTRALAPQLAAEILFEGAPLSAARLHAAGVVNRVVPPGQALAEASQWAERLAQGPGAALARAKRLLETAYAEELDSHLDREAESMTEAVHHDEAGEGIAAFLEKRPPRFRR